MNFINLIYIIYYIYYVFSKGGICMTVCSHGVFRLTGKLAEDWAGLGPQWGRGQKAQVLSGVGNLGILALVPETPSGSGLQGGFPDKGFSMDPRGGWLVDLEAPKPALSVVFYSHPGWRLWKGSLRQKYWNLAYEHGLDLQDVEWIESI